MTLTSVPRVVAPAAAPLGALSDAPTSGDRLHAILGHEDAAHAAALLAAEIHSGRTVLDAGDRARMVEALPTLLADSRGAERAALLALGAALGRLPVAVRRTLRTMAEAAEGTTLPLAVAAQVCSLLAEGFEVSDPLLADLASLVRSQGALLALARPGSARDRAVARVLAIANDLDA